MAVKEIYTVWRMRLESAVEAVTVFKCSYSFSFLLQSSGTVHFNQCICRILCILQFSIDQSVTILRGDRNISPREVDRSRIRKTVYHLFKIEEIEESHQCIKSSNIHIGYWHLDYQNNSAVTRESASPSLHPNKGHINDYIIWWTLKYSCNVVMYSRSEYEVISATISRI